MTTQTATPTQLETLSPSHWRIDPEASQISFRTRTMLGILTVQGSFKVLDGELVLGAGGEARGSMRIDAASVSTGIRKRDTHLRSEDFFHAAEHPHPEFSLASITTDESGTHIFRGELTVRGRGLPLSAPLTVDGVGNGRLRLATTVDADHKSAGFGWTKPGMIRGQIPVQAEIVLVRAGE
jgi:polyisoprenoid-binding protein YceI